MGFTADFNDTYWEPPEAEFQPLLDFESEISREAPHNDIAVLTQRIKRSFLDYVRQGVMLNTVRRYRLYQRQYKDFAEYCKLALGRSHFYCKKIIQAAEICLRLIKSEFKILPTSVAQAIPLLKFAKVDEYGHSQLQDKWQSVIDGFPPESITAIKIQETLDENPEDRAKQVKIGGKAYQLLQQKAAEAGMAVSKYLEMLISGDIESPDDDGDVEEETELTAEKAEICDRAEAYANTKLLRGIDISRSSIAACFLLGKPSNPRDDYFDADIEVFHSNLENLNRLRLKIESFKADRVVAICEPTGMNYAKFWINKLGDWGVEIRMISNSKLPNYRAELMGKDGKSGAKTDDIDAFAIACWYFDKPETAYLKVRDPIVAQIKGICLRIEHLNRLQNPIINRMRQELSWQCPEVALVRSAKLQDDLAPLLWGWLAGRRSSKKYDRLLEATIGTGIEPQTRWAANQYCEIEEEIFRLRKLLTQLINHPKFETYRRVFAKFGFGYQLQGYLLGAIYPIADFLKDGQPEIKIRKNRQTGRESKLKLSERRFMRALGMGVVREDSGQKKKGKQSGSALCRKALWQWCFCRLETSRKNPPLKFTYGRGDSQEQMSPSENLKRRKKGGTPVKLARQRVIARCVRELFKELCTIVEKPLMP